MRELAEALGIECGYARRGSLKLARTEEEAEDLRASIKLLREDGFRIAEAEVASSVPPHAVRHFRAAFVDPDDGEVDPVRFVRGVAAAAVQRGAALFERTRLLSAQWRDRVWEADVEGGHVRAGALVLANNAHAPQLCPALEPLIRPRRGQMLATAPLAERIIARPTSAHWGYQYWRQTDDGRIVLGGWRDLDPTARSATRTSRPIASRRGSRAGSRTRCPARSRSSGGGPARWASRATAGRSSAGSTPSTISRSPPATPGTG